MSIIFLLIPLSVVLASGFLIAFIWAVRSGQYEDTCTPSMRLLLNDGVQDDRVKPVASSPSDARQASAPAPCNLGAGARAGLPQSLFIDNERRAMLPICIRTKSNP